MSVSAWVEEASHTLSHISSSSYLDASSLSSDSHSDMMYNLDHLISLANLHGYYPDDDWITSCCYARDNRPLSRGEFSTNHLFAAIYFQASTTLASLIDVVPDVECLLEMAHQNRVDLNILSRANAKDFKEAVSRLSMEDAHLPGEVDNYTVRQTMKNGRHDYIQVSDDYDYASWIALCHKTKDPEAIKALSLPRQYLSDIYIALGDETYTSDPDTMIQLGYPYPNMLQKIWSKHGNSKLFEKCLHTPAGMNLVMAIFRVNPKSKVLEKFQSDILKVAIQESRVDVLQLMTRLGYPVTVVTDLSVKVQKFLATQAWGVYHASGDPLFSRISADVVYQLIMHPITEESMIQALNHGWQEWVEYHIPLFTGNGQKIVNAIIKMLNSIGERRSVYENLSGKFKYCLQVPDPYTGRLLFRRRVLERLQQLKHSSHYEDQLRNLFKQCLRNGLVSPLMTPSNAYLFFGDDPDL